jgi:cell division protease FtsH
MTIDCAERSFMNTAFDRTRTILEHKRPILEESARTLLERETLSETDLRPIFDKVTLPEAPAGV